MSTSRLPIGGTSLCLLAACAIAAPNDIHGLYRAGDGRALVICPAPNSADQTAMIESGSGRARVLFADEKQTDAYSFGRALAIPEPRGGMLTAKRDAAGRINAVEVQDDGLPPQAYQRVELLREDVKFASDDVMLAGTLILPPGDGPFPGVVMLHGSDPEKREGTLGMALLMVSSGVAALVFDKRGVGESTGADWRAALHAYAADGRAGFDLLRSDKRLDPKRLGYWGHSQGAWIAALAASHSKEAAFVVLEVGGVVSPAEASIWWGRCKLKSENRFSAAQIDALCEYRRAKFDVAAGRKSAAELEPHTNRVRGEPWFPRVTDRLPDGPFWKANAAYDPAVALAGVNHCRLLAIFAEHDDSTPTEQSVRGINAALERAKHPAYIVKTVSGANHAFLETKTGGPLEQELPTLDRFHPEYLKSLTEWLRQTTKR